MNRQIVVTGAGKGLGYSIARRHVALEDHVLALEFRVTDELLALQRENPTLVTVKTCDVSNTDAVRSALAELVKGQSPVDIVYNVAGIFFESDRVPLTETNIDIALTLYNVNALGPVRVLANVAPLLHNGSVVLNVTSEAGSIGDCKRESEYGYSMSKAAANMASKIFSNEYRSRGVRVFCLHPGWLKTDMGGEGARLSTFSVTPEESAGKLVEITTHPQDIPDDVMYMDFKRNPLPW
ncbi:MAG: SDR family NAD(P)-dependent oxidoreductase [Eubacteriales bacterium]|nr:SDR family NAD(P)-dependent oxidoreductase [Eubacteriales bacterium]